MAVATLLSKQFCTSSTIAVTRRPNSLSVRMSTDYFTCFLFFVEVALIIAQSRDRHQRVSSINMAALSEGLRRVHQAAVEKTGIVSEH